MGVLDRPYPVAPVQSSAEAGLESRLCVRTVDPRFEGEVGLRYVATFGGKRGCDFILRSGAWTKYIQSLPHHDSFGRPWTWHELTSQPQPTHDGCPLDDLPPARVRRGRQSDRSMWKECEDSAGRGGYDITVRLNTTVV